jgi:hypothetical protein
VFEPYFDRVAARATGDAHLVEVRRARRQFQELTGRFEEDEPWFEQRMALFLEWFVLDRPDREGLIPAERFLRDELDALEPGEEELFIGFTATQRSLLRIDSWQRGRIELTDMLGGGAWSIRQNEPMVGLQKGDMLDARIIPFRSELYLGRGLLFHPRIALESIQAALEKAHARGLLCFELIDLFASQRLKFDRYRNIKVDNIYRLPDDWSPQ